MSNDDDMCDVSFERRRELLSQIEGFVDLSDAVLVELAHSLKVEAFPAGQEVVVERQMGDRMYIIVEGVAEVSTDGPSGAVSLDQLSVGQMFGEVALVSKIRRRKATVTSLTSLLTLSLSSSAFEKAMAPYPEIRARFVEAAELLLKEKLSKVTKHS